MVIGENTYFLQTVFITKVFGLNFLLFLMIYLIMNQMKLHFIYLKAI